jgi:hypothetical protein
MSPWASNDKARETWPTSGTGIQGRRASETRHRSRLAPRPRGLQEARGRADERQTGREETVTLETTSPKKVWQLGTPDRVSKIVRFFDLLRSRSASTVIATRRSPKNSSAKSKHRKLVSSEVFGTRVSRDAEDKFAPRDSHLFGPGTSHRISMRRASTHASIRPRICSRSSENCGSAATARSQAMCRSIAT